MRPQAEQTMPDASGRRPEAKRNQSLPLRQLGIEANNREFLRLEAAVCANSDKGSNKPHLAQARPQSATRTKVTMSLVRRLSLETKTAPMRAKEMELNVVLAR